MDGTASRESWLGFLFSSDGRISRKRYWLNYILPATAISIVATIADAELEANQHGPAIFGLLVSLFFVWPTFAISAKRLHDRGMSGWWSGYVNLVVPFAVLFGAAYWYYQRKMHAPGAEPAPVDSDTMLIIAGIFLLLLLSWLYFTIQIGFIRGQVGANRYGDDPLPTADDVQSDKTVTVVFGIIAVVLYLGIMVLAGAAYWYYTTKIKPTEPAEDYSNTVISPDEKVPPLPDSPLTPEPTPYVPPKPAKPPAP